MHALFRFCIYLPISVPIPKGDASIPNIAPSPPLEPPGVRVKSQGFKARPKILLVLSVISNDCGTFVLTNGIPPASLSRATTAASDLAGEKTRT